MYISNSIKASIKSEMSVYAATWVLSFHTG